MFYFIIIALIFSTGALGLSVYTLNHSFQSRVLASNANDLATTKLAARIEIAHSSQQVCSKCNLRVHRYEVDTAGAVICMNCLTENR
jgi:hypothetical protein